MRALQGQHRRTARHVRCVVSLRFVVVGAATALMLAACGSDDEQLSIDDLGSQSEDGDDVDEPEAEDDPEDGDDDADAEPAAEEDDDRDEDGIASHRPPAEAIPDCGAIDDESPGATIAFPSPDGDGWQDAGDSPVTVEVVGCSNTFEANVQYEAYHGQDSQPTLDGFTMGGSLGNWEEFRFEETYWTPGEWRVVVFEIDAESGDRVDYDEQTFVVDPG